MKKSLLFAAGFVALAGFTAAGQELMPGYITWPDSQGLADYVNQWSGGTGTMTVDGQAWEDENFFVSRVKPKVRYYNVNTQVYPTITQYHADNNPDGTDKRLINWVPMGDEKRNGATTNALPNGLMDQEVFSMWSYIDHWGDWNSPWGWAPGALADVAHKNGVAVSGVASVPFGGISDGWRNAFTKFRSVDGTAVAKFLYYHGVDGLGYNSEWSSLAPTTYITPNHDKIAEYMESRNPIFENVWYAGTTDGGTCSFDQGVADHSKGIFKSASMFLNYNWWRPTIMASSVDYAKRTAKRNPFLIYAGHNMQGADPGTTNFALLKDYQYSIGLWGAHSVNMLWKERNSKGSSAEAMQRNYQIVNEQWFGNGARNPAIKQTITNNRTLRPNDDFAGMSSMMSARSTLAWSLSDEPFITYFNLGNGKFFNWKGERMNSNEWSNIGVQDYLPTWRWWFAPSFLQKDVTPGTVHLAADFTWDDAYVGGSCLQISGTSEDEYLHLFKSNFVISTGATVTVRYKLLEGSADVNLAISANNPAGYDKPVNEDKMAIMSSAQADDLQDISYSKGADGWVTVTYTFNPSQDRDLRTYGAGVIGLHFKNAKNLRMLLGELSIRPRKTWSTPAAPEIKVARVLANNYKGVDGKLIWNMPNTKAIGDPVYNSDVNTSMFRIWSQQEGEEPVMLGLTTSWAAIAFQAPNNHEGAQRMRFGVSALGLDNEQESAVSWSDYMNLPDYVGNENLVIDKTVIKPNEEFTLSFADPTHASATWEIIDPETKATVFTANGKSVTCDGIEKTGSYDVKVTTDGVAKTTGGFVAISSVETGALPQILTLGVGENNVSDNDEVKIEINEVKKFTYSGRQADGKLSRGVSLNEGWFGVNVGELGIQANTSFSVAAWVKYDELPESRSNFITIEDRQNGGWPYNNWGFFWSRITGEGTFVHPNIDTAWGMRMGSGTEGQRLFYRYDDAKINLGAWTHVAVVFEYTTGNLMRQKFYINGVQQRVGAWTYILKSEAEGAVGSEAGEWNNLEKMFPRADAYGTDTYEPEAVANNRPITSSDWIAFGGSASGITATQGCVDDFQIWGKAMTTEDVKASMAGLDGNNLPADVLGYWSLEDDVNSAMAFEGKAGANAKKQNPVARWYLMNEGNGEGAGTFNFQQPQFLPGCPFINGEKFEIVTTPSWSSRGLNTVSASGNDLSGEANLSFRRAGDYTVQLKLQNDHGSDVKEYPVVKVESSAAIGGIATDGDFTTYTIDDALFVDFAADGNYTVEVYNMSGMLVGQKQANVVAGQNAQISLGNAGVYLVKVTCDGKLLRTVKVIRK